ncbi:MAG TPA: DUF262 domain-containing HNH endonuclease family protein [Flavobacterium sp.]|uniref:DUF262 domain-containing protein n=1 Tax=Flavobacterium sp. TaxID=239 RepID=UPI002BB9713A|nr:DUF262 domain-containing HNH endonuclease family protein [Flavobacterium sp.]HSD15581.1 DUF262 domain-containing HNH endonuclease family protein [Flavobacterium sp.]
MDAGKRTINDIFNGNRILEIPFFQRAYVWGEPQWERLIEDLETVSASNKPYFLGSVILKQQQTTTGGNVGDKRTLIDGQQRLTTLNIFFKVLCLKTGLNNSFDRVFRLMNNNIALWHNHNDIADFNRIMNLATEEELSRESSIIEAYNYFRKEINVDKLNMNNILTNIMFVGIDLGIDEDEQQIFDTINSLGVRLTTAELLKNYFFHRHDVESYTENWKNVFERDTDTKKFWDRNITAGRSIRENVDLFFYSFLQIKIQDSALNVKTEDKKLFTKVDGLFDSYKKFIQDYKIDKATLIQEIKEYAEIYRNNIDFDVIDRELSAEYGIERINAIIFGLENTTLIPYVLFILKRVANSNERNLIWEYLESYLMRRMVCHETTKNYNQLFSERLISNNIITRDVLKVHIENQSDKINFMPTDSNLEFGFKNSKLVNKQAAGILYLIESMVRDRSKQSTSLLGLDRYSLEHVMPKKWENNWAQVGSEEEKSNRNKTLLTLGNLTIVTTSLNASMRDADWKTKKNGRGEKHGLRHFASGIETFSPFLEKADWDENVINERAEFLFIKAKEIWRNQKAAEEVNAIM